MKETYYFSHDYNARSDPKIINLQIKHGMQGIGCYWSIIEMLYEQGGEIPLEYERIAYVLRTEQTVIQSIINDFNLFIFQDGLLSSTSVLRRIDERKQKSTKAKESINKRWEKYRLNTNVSKTDTNVSKNDTIKERKGKERIRKESKGEIEKENHSPFELFLLENQIENNDALEFLSSEMWFESKAMQLKSQTDILIEKAKDFLVDIRHRDQIEGKQLPDLRSHFVSWFKLKREAEKPDKPVNYRLPTYD